MAEKYEQPAQGYPLAPATVIPRSDQLEYGTNYHSHDQTVKKERTKRLAYVAAFVAIPTVAIVVFCLVALRVRTPRIRLTDVRVSETLAGYNNISLTARVWIRNRNFGMYEFDGGPAVVVSGDTEVGRFLIQDARVRARSTRRFFVMAPNLSLNRGNGSRDLDLNVRARLRGEVRLLRVIRRNRWADLNCTITVDSSNNIVRRLSCD